MNLDEYRGAYKELVDSPVGKHLLQTLVEQELQFLSAAYQETDPYKKAHYVDKMAGLYWVRTYLSDMSKPPASTRGKSTRPSGQGS